MEKFFDIMLFLGFYYLIFTAPLMVLAVLKLCFYREEPPRPEDDRRLTIPEGYLKEAGNGLR